MASKYLKHYPVPRDFPEILSDLTKEILRYQPEDIIEFSALYFKCMQEGQVLSYKKMGKAIPCDFKEIVPKQRESTKENVRSTNDAQLIDAARASERNVDVEKTHEVKPVREEAKVTVIAKDNKKEVPVENIKKVEEKAVDIKTNEHRHEDLKVDVKKQLEETEQGKKLSPNTAAVASFEDVWSKKLTDIKASEEIVRSEQKRLTEKARKDTERRASLRVEEDKEKQEEPIKEEKTEEDNNSHVKETVKENNEHVEETVREDKKVEKDVKEEAVKHVEKEASAIRTETTEEVKLERAGKRASELMFDEVWEKKLEEVKNLTGNV